MELRSLRATVDARNEIRELSIVFWIGTDEAPSPTLLSDIGFRAQGGQRGLSGRQPEITKGDDGLISDGGMLVDALNHIAMQSFDDHIHNLLSKRRGIVSRRIYLIT